MSCSPVHSRVGARPAFAGCPLSVRRAPAVQAPRTLVIENAHKKGAGSTKNGRDSNSKSRGVKVYGGQPVVHGGIIVRQVGNTVRYFSLWGLNAHTPFCGVHERRAESPIPAARALAPPTGPSKRRGIRYCTAG